MRLWGFLLGKSILIASFLLAAGLGSAQQSIQAIGAVQNAPVPVSEVIRKLEARNVQRANTLERFEGDRIYRMQYRGFPSDRDAEMVVKVTFRAPNLKEFTVVSQRGSRFILDHVFKKLLEAEEDATRDTRNQAALTRENYDFELLGYEDAADGGSYVVKLVPKAKNRFLYRGKIWVDGRDFAVTRIEAEPAKNPSMWIKKTEILHTYSKIGDFWLPEENRTVSSIRLGGTATLTIEYQNYKITKAVRVARNRSQVGDTSLFDGHLATVAPTP